MHLQTVNRIINRHKDNRAALISILQDIQAEFNHLPKDALKTVSETLDIKLTDVYGVATFYKSLRLSPQGRHSVVVCTGTACHVRGTAHILDEIQSRLGISSGCTTKDGEFSFDTVNCLGACAIGPIMVIDGKYHGHMNPTKARTLLSRYSKRNRPER